MKDKIKSEGHHHNIGMETGHFLSDNQKKLKGELMEKLLTTMREFVYIFFQDKKNSLEDFDTLLTSVLVMFMREMTIKLCDSSLIGTLLDEEKRKKYTMNAWKELSATIEHALLISLLNRDE